MKRRLFLLATILLALGFAISPLVTTALAATKESKPAAASPAQRATPGVEAAQTLSMLTGVAISPLLGVGAVGAWTWFRAPDEQARARLPWYGQVWFWLPALLVVGLCAAKDTLGTAVPGALKKPADVAEALENKLSGLIGAGAFVPLLMQFAPEAAAGGGAQAAGTFYAAFDMNGLVHLLLTPFAMIAFLAVWLVANAINVLILISPFATVDAALKGMRTALLATVAGTGYFAESHPWLAAGWALLVIVVSLLLAGWAFRLTVFGGVFIWDFLTLRRRRFTPEKESLWMFTSRRVGPAPVRTYGKLLRDAAGKLVFRYRPMLVLPPHELVLPEGVYAVGRGILYPELVQIHGEDHKTILLLPPRYRTHEETVTHHLDLAPIRDVGLLAGVKAVWRWIKTLFGFGIAAESTA